MKSHAEKCPVCDGAGVFNNQIWSEIDYRYTRICHGCGGRGWVVVKDIEEVVKEVLEGKENG
jgi:DnaJ-class molecular chaperone